MTNEEIKMCLARMTDGKSSDVMNFDYAGTLKYICTLEKENRKLKEEIESKNDELQYEHNAQMDWFEQCCKLNSENAELRARIDKAVEIPFCVIDKKTGKEADIYNIALNEEWANHLIYCDMEGFAIQEDGTLVLLDECNNMAYCPCDRFEIISEARLAELKGEKK